MVHVARNCVICSRLTSDFSYGVDCCNACKMFFRRHVVKESPLKPCLSGNEVCPPDTLAGCQFCRFHKCLQSGMTLEPLIPKPPLNDFIENLSKLDSYRYQILCNYYPIDPDLNVATVLFFKKVMYTEREPESQMNFTSWIYMSALATIEVMKKFPFVYLAKPGDQLILTRSSFMNVSSFCAAFRAYSSNQEVLSFPDGSDVLPYEFVSSRYEEIGNRIRRRLISKFVDLKINKDEFLLLLVLIFCNPALPNLSETGQILVSTYQNVYSSALFQYCSQKYEKCGPIRYTELLSVISVIGKHAEDVNNYFVISQLHGIDCFIPSIVEEGINLL
ncbi:unnamed protein product [Caenorhabditis nigoni]|uniref:Nuclear receptor domain-containing protein n=2 Tax=Caenorhabditis nigoni TaxID=1611254 RepID=A0A2G5TAG0_9PELO|nr:hypothetical protein B9Z55_017641 [Caenorhabditis nigoni]